MRCQTAIIGEKSRPSPSTFFQSVQLMWLLLTQRGLRPQSKVESQKSKVADHIPNGYEHRFAEHEYGEYVIVILTAPLHYDCSVSGRLVKISRPETGGCRP